MTRRAPFLLSPHRLATKDPSTVTAADAAVLLDCWCRLWRAEVLRRASQRPRLASLADHEPARGDALYALSGLVPDHWPSQARAAGAEILDFPQPESDDPYDFDLAALGLGLLVLEALTEAMDHLFTLDEAGFWSEIETVACAEALPESRAAAAQRAAKKLKEAREVLYPSQFTLLEFSVLHDLPPADWSPGPLADNLLCSGALLERWARERSTQFALLHQAVVCGRVEVLGSAFEERDDALLPLSMQEENLRRGLAAYRQHLGHDPFVVGQLGPSFGPHTPQLLLEEGVRHAVLTPPRRGRVPTFRGAILEWPARDGQSITALVRPWRWRDDSAVLLNLPHYLHETIMQDFAAVLGLAGYSPRGPAWHRLWTRLHELAPVFGQHQTLRHWFSDAYASERPPRLRADDFFADALAQAAETSAPAVALPLVHAEAAQVQAARTLTAMHAWLAPAGAAPEAVNLSAAAQGLARRLVANSTTAEEGFMVLNPACCARTVLVTLPDVTTPMPPPARATQLAPGLAHAVIDLPPLGYAWLPRRIAPGTRILMPQGTLAEGHLLRNDRLQAAIDPQTGGLRDLRIPGVRAGRLGQQLVHRGGSRMVARSVQITSTGPAFGQMVSTGDLVDEQGQPLARFEQQATVIWGQPYLHLKISLDILRQPTGYVWHDYFACRFAWSDATALLARATGWLLEATNEERLEAPLGVELHAGGGRTAILTRGLASLHRVGPRMVDVILIAAGATQRSFEISLALDPEDLVTAADDVLAPAPVVPVSSGPPRSGPVGWLIDCDAPNLWITGVSRPMNQGGQGDAVLVHLVEVRGLATEARLRCCRPVRAAATVDHQGQVRQSVPAAEEGVTLGVAPWEKLSVRLSFDDRPG